jgi:hypothetical protein
LWCEMVLACGEAGGDFAAEVDVTAQLEPVLKKII